MSDDVCGKCKGRGWVWETELDERIHKISKFEDNENIEDTKYMCDWCNGTKIKFIKEKFKYDQEDFQKYDRTPIILGHQTLALLEIYSKKGRLNSREAFKMDMLDTNKGFNEVNHQQYEKEAEKLIKAFEGNVCDAFMIALMREIFRYLKEGDVKLGNDRFGEEVERLIEEVKVEYMEKLGDEDK
jgi:hypothetical protein